MARPSTVYVCAACGYRAARWMGKCPDCGAWNQLEEQVVDRSARKAAPRSEASGGSGPIPLPDVPTGGEDVRVRTGIKELDTALGGGLVAGSLVLLGGDPGVGKSTLLLTALDRFAQRGVDVLYVTGEESLRQVALRATRLGVRSATLHLMAETDFGIIEGAVRRTQPRVVVIDSVQVVRVPELESIPGTVSQVREVAHRSMLLAKQTGIAVLLVGHVTKSGDLAGPRVLEHLVDAVLHFEGDGRSTLRILRAVKNRFGPAGELGLFEMADDGLREVPDASARLLAERAPEAPGTAVVATLEGSRPLLTEIQALVGEPSLGTPARTCVGIDRGRVGMLTAVLQKCGLQLHDRDLFTNAAGGVTIEEPAADLAIAAAIASSMRGRPLDRSTVVFGEIGLVGEVRSVSYPLQRLREAARHGFRRVVAPPAALAEVPPGIEAVPVKTIVEALEALVPRRAPTSR
jgi:DNA repair protein RadA/Sms